MSRPLHARWNLGPTVGSAVALDRAEKVQVVHHEDGGNKEGWTAENVWARREGTGNVVLWALREYINESKQMSELRKGDEIHTNSNVWEIVEVRANLYVDGGIARAKLIE